LTKYSHSALVEMTQEKTAEGLRVTRWLFVERDTQSLAVAKRPCDCCMGQFWPNVTGRRYFADTI